VGGAHGLGGRCLSVNTDALVVAGYLGSLRIALDDPVRTFDLVGEPPYRQTNQAPWSKARVLFSCPRGRHWGGMGKDVANSAACPTVLQVSVHLRQLTYLVPDRSHVSECRRDLCLNPLIESSGIFLGVL
jgi:hypothetical protein